MYIQGFPFRPRKKYVCFRFILQGRWVGIFNGVIYHVQIFLIYNTIYMINIYIYIYIYIFMIYNQVYCCTI